mmetsp:Transcript_57090/g.102012  ORF Transcript_57090/g.102012 Transcript_57090/m.102012 type:complete len:254 (+) Transcript_57090:408-1169(+)
MLGVHAGHAARRGQTVRARSVGHVVLVAQRLAGHVDTGGGGVAVDVVQHVGEAGVTVVDLGLVEGTQPGAAAPGRKARAEGGIEEVRGPPACPRLFEFHGAASGQRPPLAQEVDQTADEPDGDDACNGAENGRSQTVLLGAVHPGAPAEDRVHAPRRRARWGFHRLPEGPHRRFGLSVFDRPGRELWHHHEALHAPCAAALGGQLGGLLLHAHHELASEGRALGPDAVTHQPVHVLGAAQLLHVLLTGTSILQ